jgi:2-iminoacetate synthase ThiH
MDYTSYIILQSRVCDGVSYTIRKLSLKRRIELIKRLRDLCIRSEVLLAGKNAEEKVEAALAIREIQEIYLEWGLKEITGLSIDGEPATVASLISSGPEKLTEEIVEAIQSEIHLSESERKN